MQTNSDIRNVERRISRISYDGMAPRACREEEEGLKKTQRHYRMLNICTFLLTVVTRKSIDVHDGHKLSNEIYD